MTVRKRTLLRAVGASIGAAVVGCTRRSSSRRVPIAFVRVVNLDDTAVDSRLVLSPTANEDRIERMRTLTELSPGGNGRADVLLCRLSDRPAVSAYEFSLYLNGDRSQHVDGQQIQEHYQEADTTDSCVVLHFYINEWRSDVSFSTELYRECDLPTGG